MNPLDVLSGLSTGIDSNALLNIKIDTQERLDNLKNLNNPEIKLPSAAPYINKELSFNSLLSGKYENPPDMYTAMGSTDPKISQAGFEAYENSLINSPTSRGIGLGRTFKTQEGQERFYEDHWWKEKQYTEYGFDPNKSVRENEGRINELVWDNYSLWGKGWRTVGTIAGRVGAQAVLKFGQLVGDVGSALFNLLQEGIDATGATSGNEFWKDVSENALSRNLENAEEYLKQEILPVYKSLDYDDKGIFSKMGTAAFWSDEFADGAAFMLSAFIPVGELSALLMAGKAARPGSLLFSGAGKLSKGLGKATKFVTGENSLSSLSGWMYRTSSESLFEAAGNYKEVKRKYKEQGLSDEEANGLASKAAGATFRDNMLILAASNAWEQRTLFNPLFTKRASKSAMGATLDESLKATTQLGNNWISRSANFLRYNQSAPMFYGRKLAAGITAEGLYEENFQLAAQRVAAGDRYTIENEKEELTASNTFLQGFKQIGDLVAGKDYELQTSVALGGILGGGSAVIMSKFGNRYDSEGNVSGSAIDINTTANKIGNLFRKEENKVKTKPSEKGVLGERRGNKLALQTQIRTLNNLKDNFFNHNSAEIWEYDNEKKAFKINDEATSKARKVQLEAVQTLLGRQAEIEEISNPALRQSLQNELLSKYVNALDDAGLSDYFIEKLKNVSKSTPEDIETLGLNLKNPMFSPKEIIEKVEKLKTIRAGIVNGHNVNNKWFEEFEGMSDYEIQTLRNTRKNLAYSLATKNWAFEPHLEQLKSQALSAEERLLNFAKDAGVVSEELQKVKKQVKLKFLKEAINETVLPSQKEKISKEISVLEEELKNEESFEEFKQLMDSISKGEEVDKDTMGFSLYHTFSNLLSVEHYVESQNDLYEYLMDEKDGVKNTILYEEWLEANAKKHKEDNAPKQEESKETTPKEEVKEEKEVDPNKTSFTPEELEKVANKEKEQVEQKPEQTVNVETENTNNEDEEIPTEVNGIPVFSNDESSNSITDKFITYLKSLNKTHTIFTNSQITGIEEKPIHEGIEDLLGVMRNHSVIGEAVEASHKVYKQLAKQEAKKIIETTPETRISNILAKLVLRYLNNEIQTPFYLNNLGKNELTLYINNEPNEIKPERLAQLQRLVPLEDSEQTPESKPESSNTLENVKSTDTKDNSGESNVVIKEEPKPVEGFFNRLTPNPQPKPQPVPKPNNTGGFFSRLEAQPITSEVDPTLEEVEKDVKEIKIQSVKSFLVYTNSHLGQNYKESDLESKTTDENLKKVQEVFKKFKQGKATLSDIISIKFEEEQPIEDAPFEVEETPLKLHNDSVEDNLSESDSKYQSAFVTTINVFGREQIKIDIDGVEESIYQVEKGKEYNYKLNNFLQTRLSETLEDPAYELRVIKDTPELAKQYLSDADYKFITETIDGKEQIKPEYQGVVVALFKNNKIDTVAMDGLPVVLMLDTTIFVGSKSFRDLIIKKIEEGKELSTEEIRQKITNSDIPETLKNRARTRAKKVNKDFTNEDVVENTETLLKEYIDLMRLRNRVLETGTSEKIELTSVSEGVKESRKNPEDSNRKRSYKVLTLKGLNNSNTELVMHKNAPYLKYKDQYIPVMTDPIENYKDIYDTMMKLLFETTFPNKEKAMEASKQIKAFLYFKKGISISHPLVRQTDPSQGYKLQITRSKNGKLENFTKAEVEEYIKGSKSKKIQASKLNIVLGNNPDVSLFGISDYQAYIKPLLKTMVFPFWFNKKYNFEKINTYISFSFDRKGVPLLKKDDMNINQQKTNTSYDEDDDIDDIDDETPSTNSTETKCP